MALPVVDVRTEGGNTGSAGATSLSWNHTVAAGLTNSILVGTGQVANGTGSDITNFQWDAAGSPVAMAKLGSQRDTAVIATAAIWSLLAPASGTKQVKITPAASAQISGGSASYSTVDQTTPWNAASPQKATGTVAPQPSLAVTSGVNELAIVCVIDDDAGATSDTLTCSASSGTATAINNDNLGSGNYTGASHEAPGASTVTFTYAGASATNTWAIIGGSLRGTAGGGWVGSGSRQAPAKAGPFDRLGMLLSPYQRYNFSESAAVVGAASTLQRKTLSPLGTHTGGRQSQ